MSHESSQINRCKVLKWITKPTKGKNNTKVKRVHRKSLESTKVSFIKNLRQKSKALA